MVVKNARESHNYDKCQQEWQTPQCLQKILADCRCVEVVASGRVCKYLRHTHLHLLTTISRYTVTKITGNGKDSQSVGRTRGSVQNFVRTDFCFGWKLLF